MMKLKTIPLALAAAGWLISSSAVAQTSDQRMQQLESQVRTLMQQLEELKAEQNKAKAAAQAPAPANAVTELKNQVEANQKEAVVGGDIPGSFRVPGSDTSIRVYGFAEMTAWRDNKGATSGDFSSATAFQPLDGSPDANRKGNVKFGARTSRLGVEASTPTKYGALGAKVEFDFATEVGSTLPAAGDPNTQAGREAYTNSYRPRLRHGYVSLGPWTFGQTWSTFMDLDTLPETLDFNGVPASPFVRQPMIKYAYATPNYGTFTAALENSVSLVTDAGSPRADNFDKRPDVIFRYDKSHDWGSWNARLLNTEYRINNGAGLSAKRNGYGFGLGATIKTRGDDFFTVQYTDGNGLGRYNISFADAAVYDATNNKILFEKARGIVLGYQLKLNDAMRANFAYAVQVAQNNDFAAVVANNRKITQGHINFIWTPVKNFDLGTEYLWGTRETFGGGTGKLNRVMGSAKYSF
jgi:outer membrane murein-binding lipoprotein Lpp